MASSLLRMFHFAKATEAEAKENFTTEALAAAIRTDPLPFLAAVREGCGIDLPLPEGSRVSATTQVSVRGAGQIDMVVSVGGRKLWVEVKVDSGENGGQLLRYNTFIRSQPEEHRPQLIVVGPKKLGDGTAWLAWQCLRTAIGTSRTICPYWIDLKTYLEEIGMADRYDESVTAEEARTLHASRGLLGKVGRILTPFALGAGRIWPGSSWPSSEPKVIDSLLRTLASHGSMAISNADSYRANLSAGVYHERTSEDAWLGLWIWARPNRIDERRQILQSAEGPWDDDWARDPGEWELFGAYRRLVTFEPGPDATRWLLAKLTQLRDGGMLELLPRLGTADPQELTRAEEAG